MDTPQTRATALLIDDLRELQRRAGSPSAEKLATHSPHNMSAATFRRLVSKHRAGLPSWKHVSAFVTACHTAAESIGLEKSQLRTVDEWLARWESAKSGNLDSGSIFAPTIPFSALDADADPDLQASIEQILERLDKDLEKWQKSLSRNAGLLVAISEPKFGAIYKVENHVTTIGRHPGNDIWLLNRSVSHWHAQITRFGNQFTIRDQGSVNGIVRRKTLIKDSALRSYDELRIGRLRFLFVQGGDTMEGFQSSKYDPARQSLIQEITAETAKIEPSDSFDDDVE